MRSRVPLPVFVAAASLLLLSAIWTVPVLALALLSGLVGFGLNYGFFGTVALAITPALIAVLVARGLWHRSTLAFVVAAIGGAFVLISAVSMVVPDLLNQQTIHGVGVAVGVISALVVGCLAYSWGWFWRPLPSQPD